MTQIREYVLLLVATCLICGGLTILAPNGQFERSIRLIASVFLLICLLSPLKNTWSQLNNNGNDFRNDNFTYSENESWGNAANAMSKTIRDEIDGLVLAVTGNHAQEISVDIRVENKNFSAHQIIITLQDDDMIKASAVADYVAIKIGVRPQVISNSEGE